MAARTRLQHGDGPRSRPTDYDAFDERWRDVGRFRSSDSSPKEEFLYHAAGLDGLGGSSYIDLVVLRDRDNNTAWTAASDGVLEARAYYCQNWRADVSAIVTAGGSMVQWAKYSAYGVPFGLPGGDTDSDGDCDATDVAQVQTWIDAPAYDVRGDIDLDGDVDVTDKATIQGSFEGDTLGPGALSSHDVRIRHGYVAREHRPETIFIRNRIFMPGLGDWASRDQLLYLDGPNLYSYAKSSPIALVDRTGGQASSPAPGSTGGTGGQVGGNCEVTTWEESSNGSTNSDQCWFAALAGPRQGAELESNSEGCPDAGHCTAKVRKTINIEPSGGRDNWPSECRRRYGEADPRTGTDPADGREKWHRRDDSVNWGESFDVCYFGSCSSSRPFSSEGPVTCEVQNMDCGHLITCVFIATANDGDKLIVQIAIKCKDC